MAKINLILCVFLMSVSSWATQNQACVNVNKDNQFTLSGLLSDKRVDLQFNENSDGFKLQIKTESQNNLVQLMSGRSAYSITTKPYRIYRQKSALGADILDCHQSAAACESIRREISSLLEKIERKTDHAEVSVLNALRCAQAITQTVN